MTQEEYNAVKKPLQDAEALIPQIEDARGKYTEAEDNYMEEFKATNDNVSYETELEENSWYTILTDLEANFTALISECIKLLIEQRKANSGVLNSLYPCPSYYSAMSAYETLFKNQPKEDKR